MKEPEVPEQNLLMKVDDLTLRKALQDAASSLQRHQEKLLVLREEVQSVTLGKERSKTVWRDRLRHCQLQLRMKQEEMKRQCEYFQLYKQNQQQKLRLAGEREQSLRKRIRELELEQETPDRLATGALLRTGLERCPPGGTPQLNEEQEEKEHRKQTALLEESEERANKSNGLLKQGAPLAETRVQPQAPPLPNEPEERLGGVGTQKKETAFVDCNSQPCSYEGLLGSPVLPLLELNSQSVVEILQSLQCDGVKEVIPSLRQVDLQSRLHLLLMSTSEHKGVTASAETQGVVESDSGAEDPVSIHEDGMVIVSQSDLLRLLGYKVQRADVSSLHEIPKELKALVYDKEESLQKVSDENVRLKHNMVERLADRQTCEKPETKRDETDELQLETPKKSWAQGSKELSRCNEELRGQLDQLERDSEQKPTQVGLQISLQKQKIHRLVEQQLGNIAVLRREDQKPAELPQNVLQKIGWNCVYQEESRSNKNMSSDTVFAQNREVGQLKEKSCSLLLRDKTQQHILFSHLEEERQWVPENTVQVKELMTSGLSRNLRQTSAKDRNRMDQEKSDECLDRVDQELTQKLEDLQEPKIRSQLMSEMEAQHTNDILRGVVTASGVEHTDLRGVDETLPDEKIQLPGEIGHLKNEHTEHLRKHLTLLQTFGEQNQELFVKKGDGILLESNTQNIAHCQRSGNSTLHGLGQMVTTGSDPCVGGGAGALNPALGIHSHGYLGKRRMEVVCQRLLPCMSTRCECWEKYANSTHPELNSKLCPPKSSGAMRQQLNLLGYCVPHSDPWKGLNCESGSEGHMNNIANRKEVGVFMRTFQHDVQRIRVELTLLHEPQKPQQFISVKETQWYRPSKMPQVAMQKSHTTIFSYRTVSLAGILQEKPSSREGKETLRKELEATAADLRKSQEELEKAKAEAQKWYRELGLAECRREEAEKKASQALNEARRMRKCMKEAEVMKSRSDSLKEEMGHVKERVLQLEKEQTDALFLRSHLEEQLAHLQANFDTKCAAEGELRAENASLKSQQDDLKNFRDTLKNLKACYDHAKHQINELHKKTAQADIAMAPLKAKLAYVAQKCRERNRLIVRMARVLESCGCGDSALMQEAEDMVNDASLLEYSSTFLPGQDNTLDHHRGLWEVRRWTDQEDSVAGTETSLSDMDASLSYRLRAPPTHCGPSAQTPQTGLPTLPLSAGEGMQVVGLADSRGLYRAQLVGEGGLVTARFLDERKEPRPQTATSGSTSPARSPRPTGPQKILELHRQLQQVHCSSYQNPSFPGSSPSQRWGTSSLSSTFPCLELISPLHNGAELAEGTSRCRRKEEESPRRDKVSCLCEEPKSSQQDQDNRATKPKTLFPGTRPTKTKPDPPAAVASVEILKRVGQSGLMISWERPPLDELGCSNGTFVSGYMICVNGEFRKSVVSSACTKTVLENLDLSLSLHISVQTLGSNGLLAEKVYVLSKGMSPPPGSAPPPRIHRHRWTAQPFVALCSYSPLKDSPDVRPGREPTFREGDAVRVFGAPRRDGFCEAEVDGRRGLAPMALLEEVGAGLSSPDKATGSKYSGPKADDAVRSVGFLPPALLRFRSFAKKEMPDRMASRSKEHLNPGARDDDNCKNK
ncbi:uncharacterized protein LOC108924191 isoform X1 [Scleropages formosus]|nr:uncharacterized protein C4orf50 homolog isoform X1 [Scleropages formosus]